MAFEHIFFALEFPKNKQQACYDNFVERQFKKNKCDVVCGAAPDISWSVK